MLKSIPFGAILVFLLALVTSAEAVTYRYYRFETTRVRAGFSARTVQLSEFSFYATETAKVTAVPTVTNPGGNNPDGEGPGNLVDNSTATKWLDFNRAPLVFDFGTPTTVDHFGFTTANDASERDPVRWRFQGSHDGSTWTTLDSRTGSNVSYPTTRFASYEYYYNQVTPVPVVSFSASAGPVVSSTGLNLTPGGSATLNWQMTGATSASLSDGTGVLSTSTSGTLLVSPSTTRTYTVTGTNAGGSTVRAITVNVGAPVTPPVINEFMARAANDKVALLDEDYEMSDWIEIHNPNSFALSMADYGLTDSASQSSLWPFPGDCFIDAGGYLIVFASGKNRSVVGQPLHTGFSLSVNGEYLGLIGPGGTPVDAFSPAFPAQFDDVSYGRVTGGGHDFFTDPTPGGENDTPPGPPGFPVIFTTPASTFTATKEVTLAVDSPGAEIRYTLNGSIPTSTSTLYTGPITLSATTLVKARSYEPGRAPGPVAAAAFQRLTTTLAAQTSDLPVIVIENFAAGSVPNQEVLQPSHFSLFEPDPVSGRTSLTADPTVAKRIGIKRRGSSTLNDAKGSYRVEFWQDGTDEEEDVNLLGMSDHDEWVLYAPYTFDRALMRNAFLFETSNAAGTYAPRTRFVEVYLNTNGGSLETGDYQGVYVLMERISRNSQRVDVQKLNPWDNSEPRVSGGYMLSIDRLDPSDQGFRSALNHPSDPPNASPQPFFTYVYPKEQNITPAQSAYIRGYIDDLESALYGPDFKDPATGYAAWLDVDASIDHHIFVAFSKDPDGLRLSTYLYKPRGGKLAFGPIWDFDRAMGPDSDNRAANPVGWQPPYETAEYFEYDYWGRLFQDPDFMQKWIDRWQVLRRGPLSDAAMQARVDAMAAQLAESQVRNAQRWTSVAPNGGPLSSLSGYAGEVDHLKNWLFQRGAWIDSQFVAPPLVEAGGSVSPGHVAVITPTSGTLYYTLDGSDPRLPGGAISPAAIEFIGSGPVIQDTSTLTARSYLGGQWSGSVIARYVVGVPASADSLVISEVMYHPADPTPSEVAAGYIDDGVFEYLEFQNVSHQTIELSGVIISECFPYDFSGAEITTIPPGGVVLVVRNRAAFELRYGTGLPIAGQWGDPSSPSGGANLSNSGERVLITAANGDVIHDFTYSDRGAWPTVPDGNGPSLELSSPFGLPDHGLAASWKASAEPSGSPGVGSSYYDFWAGSQFSPAQLEDPAISGPDSDPDGDGLANLIELAFGGQPLSSSPDRFPQVALQEIEVQGQTDRYLTITFTRVPGLPGLTIQPQFGDTLQTWTHASAWVGTVTNGDGSETVTYRDIIPADGPRRFARVLVLDAD